MEGDIPKKVVSKHLRIPPHSFQITLIDIVGVFSQQSLGIVFVRKKGVVLRQ